MTAPATRLVCAGCGASPGPEVAYPFRCPAAGPDDTDHVLVKVLDVGRLRFPPAAAGAASPFEDYRTLLHSYHRAAAGGVDDDAFVDLVRRTDQALAAVEGHGFLATPFARDAGLSSRLGFSEAGGVWVKDETGNVAGSHKARHLMGVLLHLEVAEMIGLASPRRRPVLAIASCGNAALAAGVVSAAAGRRLRVFIPVDADAAVTDRLAHLGAELVTCPRTPGVVGDPTYLRLLEELDGGAIAFTCQGNLNGLAIEGGETLGYEMASELARLGGTLDHLVVQVGGGALASSCAQSLDTAHALGALARVPRLHTVQSEGAHPLERAYRLVRDLLPAAPARAEIDAALGTAAAHRSRYMWPWESEPKSMASGILDDETYDWLQVVGAMLRTGGRPVVVGEDRLAEAHAMGGATGANVDPTGSAGLAGLLELLADGAVRPDERVAVLFTGVER